MTARLIPTASEAEWLAARRNGVTASEIAVLMGLSPYSSPYALYHQKLGVLDGPDETEAMALGTHMEPFIAGRFAERYAQFYVEGDGHALYAHPDRPWQMATPDRILTEKATQTNWQEFIDAEPVAVLECKIDGGSDEWGDDGSDQIPVHYRCQVLWQMDVMGVTTGYVACLLWSRRKVQVYEITRDDQAEADLKLMREEASGFLGRLANGPEPDIDWRPATTGALKQLHPDVEDRDVAVNRMPIISYRSACRRYKEAEQRKKLAENRLRGLLGNGHRIVSAHTGEVVARRDVYDVKEHTRRASHVDKLVPVKPPAPKEQP